MNLKAAQKRMDKYAVTKIIAFYVVTIELQPNSNEAMTFSRKYITK